MHDNFFVSFLFTFTLLDTNRDKMKASKHKMNSNAKSSKTLRGPTHFRPKSRKANSETKLKSAPLLKTDEDISKSNKNMDGSLDGKMQT